MNWKLILQLSLFGLAMGIATAFWVPPTGEPFLWLAIFVLSAFVIATRAGGNAFGHGVLLGLANSVWVTLSHLVLFNQYVANHAKQLEMVRTMPVASSARLMMAVTGPIIGLVSGLILGLFAFFASKLVKRSDQPLPAA